MSSPQHYQHHLRNNPYKVAIASMIGTVIEFCDYYVYAAAAMPVFNSQFFDKDDPAIVTLLSLSTLALVFLARPVGSAFFGHFDDKIGRKKTLVASLLTMGLSTVCISLLPIYQEIDLLAPLLLCVCRIGQGIGLGDEWGGAALIATENALKGKRARLGTFLQLGAPIGLLMANGVLFLINSIIGHDALVEWGWRIPFVASLVLVLVSLWMRMTMHESHVYHEAEEQGRTRVALVKKVFAGHRKPVLQGTFIMVSIYVLFYITVTFAQVYSKSPAKLSKFGHPQGLGIPANMFTGFLMISAVVFGAFISFSGIYAGKIGRRHFLIWVAFAMLAFSLLMPQFLTHGSSASTLAFLLIGMALMGLTFGPMAALLPELFPIEVCYSGASLAYNFAAVIGASTAILVIIGLNAYYGIIGVGVYLAVNCVLTLAALTSTHETKNVDLVDTQ